MKKRLQVQLTDDAWEMVEHLAKEGNSGFDSGYISYSDAINEMILTSKVDIRTLQMKHADLRRSLRSLASRRDLDVETVLRLVAELKTKTQKRKSKAMDTQEVNV